MDSEHPLGSDGLTHDIVRQIQDGNAAAWDTLWNRLHDDLLFVIRCRLGPHLRHHLESEDVFQSVALEAMHELPHFEPKGPGGLRRFLSVLITRKLRDQADHFATAKRRGTRSLDDPGVAPPATWDPAYRDPDHYAPLEQALLALSAEAREVVLLHRMEGLPTREVAEKLGRTDAAVRKIYSRALLQLRGLLGGP